MRVGLIFLSFIFASLLVQSQSTPFRPHVAIIKVKSEYREKCSVALIEIEGLQKAFESIQVDQVVQKFPNAKVPEASRYVAVENPTDVSLIFEVHFNSDLEADKAADLLKQSGVLEYAEPAFISQLAVIPSDQMIYRQWHLEAIRAYEAWDIQQGSDEIVIGITDTGIDIDHEDLASAMVLNENDPVDGIDNDQNGYVDDYLGWNFYNDNNNPDEFSWSHGTHVSGLAGAATNNGIGIAGTSFNCKILSIKCGDKLELTHGYEGVIYALERGADIINCSWGSTSYTEYGNDVMKYATEQGALVVCAAGNNNDERDFYPASFGVTLSVAASDSLTQKAIFSSYNYNVDVTAPGQWVISTKNDNTYAQDNGTSMASPIVAGAAALVKLRFPNMTPAQIKAQIVNTAKNIYGTENNQKFLGQLGSGLLDMRSALDSVVKHAVSMENFVLTDNDDEAYLLDDELELGIEMVNWLGETEGLIVSLVSLNPKVEVVDALRHFPALKSNARTNNYTDPFKLKVVGDGNTNEPVVLRLDITDGTFNYQEYVTFIINPDFVNVDVNHVSSTFSSAGQIGFIDNELSKGLGFQLEWDGNFLYEAGLMVGALVEGKSKVLDRIRNENRSTDRDFWSVIPARRYTTADGSAFYATGTFSDTIDTNMRSADKIGIRVRQQIIAYNQIGHENYIKVIYTLINTSGNDLSDVYAGIYADWDISNPEQNSGETLLPKQLALIEATQTGLLAGIQSLNTKQSLKTDQPFISYFIDNQNGGSGGVDISYGGGGFSDEKKFTTLSTNHPEIEVDDDGTDLSHVVSAGPFSIKAGDSAKVAFALMAARTKETLVATADSAYKKHNGTSPGATFPFKFKLKSISPNPTAGAVRVQFDLKENQVLQFKLIDASGQIVQDFGELGFYSGSNILDMNIKQPVSGIYFLHIHNDKIDEAIRLNVIRP
jgi:serine protease